MIRSRGPGKALGAGELLDQALSIIRALRQERLSVAVLVNERLDVALLAGVGRFSPPGSVFFAGLGQPAPCKNWPGRRRWSLSPPESVSGTVRSMPSVMKAIRSALESTPSAVFLSAVRFTQAWESRRRAPRILITSSLVTSLKPSSGRRTLPLASALAQVVAVSPVPVYAAGGIDPDNAADVICAGAAGIAVISAILDAPDPLQAAMALRHAVDAAWKRRLGSMSG